MALLYSPRLTANSMVRSSLLDDAAEPRSLMTRGSVRRSHLWRSTCDAVELGLIGPSLKDVHCSLHGTICRLPTALDARVMPCRTNPRSVAGASTGSACRREDCLR